MKQLKDAIGQLISVGDILAYGHALGRCTGLRIGKVLSINPPKKDLYSARPATITVWGIDHEWLSSAPKLCKTKGVLQFPERTVVLDPKKVRKDYVALLNQVPLPKEKANA